MLNGADPTVAWKVCGEPGFVANIRTRAKRERAKRGETGPLVSNTHQQPELSPEGMFWTKDGPIPRPSDEELARDLNHKPFPCPCPRIYRHLEKTWVKPRTHTRPDCLMKIAREYQNAHGGSRKKVRARSGRRARGGGGGARVRLGPACGGGAAWPSARARGARLSTEPERAKPGALSRLSARAQRKKMQQQAAQQQEQALQAQQQAAQAQAMAAAAAVAQQQQQQQQPQAAPPPEMPVQQTHEAALAAVAAAAQMPVATVEAVAAAAAASAQVETA